MLHEEACPEAGVREAGFYAGVRIGELEREVKQWKVKYFTHLAEDIVNLPPEVWEDVCALRPDLIRRLQYHLSPGTPSTPPPPPPMG